MTLPELRRCYLVLFFQLSLEINIPKDMIYQYSVWNGKVKIISNENVLTNINIKVINSKYI